MNEHAATLYMAQKLMTEAYTLPCALDKAGNIRHDKRWCVRHMHYAEHRGDGRKVVVCNVRFRFTYNGNKRRFTYIWEAYKAHISEQLEFKLKLECFTGCAGLCKARSLARRRRKMRVAPATAAALRDNDVFVCGHVRHDAAGLRIADQCAARHGNDERLCAFAEAALAAAVFAALCGVLALVAEIRQRGEVIVHAEHDVAAATAVAAVRAAGSHVFFTVKSHGAVAAVTGFYLDLSYIDKHNSSSFQRRGRLCTK